MRPDGEEKRESDDDNEGEEREKSRLGEKEKKGRREGNFDEEAMEERERESGEDGILEK